MRAHCIIGCLVAGAVLAMPAAAPAADGVSVERSAETGKVSFLSTAPGATIDRPTGLSGSAGVRETAHAYAGAYGRRFGATGPGSELRVDSVERAPGGGRTVRLQQFIQGLPVVGGELIVNLDERHRATSLSGEAEPDAPGAGKPQVSEAEAADAAIAAVARSYEVDPSALEASAGELSISDARILGGPGLARPTLVWRFEVADRGEVTTIREFVLVDAVLGNVETMFSQIHAAKDRVVCDAANADDDVPCVPPFDRVEGGPDAAEPEVNNAHDYTGDTYDLFETLGRDSLDDAGLQLKSTVRFCPAGEPCPMENAFWNGSQMIYGDGFAAADDVVGHELTHGVTDFSSHLFYYYQSGAINESMSDVFGEFVDLTNGAGDDSAGVRWLLGEDLPIGAIRDMKTPGAFGHPDRMQSPSYFFDPDTNFEDGDSGGVHVNSGVNNKAAYLMTDGDSFNGQTVAGLGIEKVKRIYYRVNNALLSSASDYQDLAVALRQACADLAGTAGITAADCQQVEKAVLATEMDQSPAAAPTVHLGACDDPAETATNAFFDDFEDDSASGVPARWAKAATVGTAEWYYPPAANPHGFDATYARSGDKNLWGYNQELPSDTDMRMTVDVTVPKGGLLRFEHANGFDTDAGTTYDGGVLEYSRDGGSSWSDLGPMITDGGYNGTIAAGPNPLAGRAAFVGESAGYRTTRADLGSLAGKSIRLRFRMGTDTLGDDYGWFIDDVQIYRCRNTVAPQTRIKKVKPSKKKIKTKKKKAKVKVKFTGSDDLTPKSKLKFQCKAGRRGFKPCSSPKKFRLKSRRRGNGRKHVIKVRAVDQSGNKDPSPARVKVRVKRKRR